MKLDEDGVGFAVKNYLLKLVELNRTVRLNIPGGPCKLISAPALKYSQDVKEYFFDQLSGKIHEIPNGDFNERVRADHG